MAVCELPGHQRSRVGGRSTEATEGVQMPSDLTPLKHAMSLIDEALAIARREACSRTILPTPQQLEELAGLRDLMWMHHCAANAMLRSARERCGIETEERSKPFEGEGPLRDWHASLEKFAVTVFRAGSGEGEK
jgi:hypothetical protein